MIVSANGMLADAHGLMPDSLKFAADQSFFENALDHVDLIVHGRNSYEDQPRSPQRRRIIVTGRIPAIAPDATNPKATLWNPAGAAFDDACRQAGVTSGTAAIIGGPVVFSMFMDRYDTFWLSEAPRVRLPRGEGCFVGVPERTSHEVLASHGMKPGAPYVLDADHEVTVTPWRSARSSS